MLHLSVVLQGYLYSTHSILELCFLNGMQMIQHFREMAMNALKKLSTETTLNLLFDLPA